MANKITYADKVSLNVRKVHENQVWDTDLNEIKDKHNLNDDRITVVENSVVSIEATQTTDTTRVDDVENSLSDKLDKGTYTGDAQDLKDEIDSINFENLKTYQTLADLNAVASPTVNDSAIVANDGTATNNGYYGYDGAAWVKNAELFESVVEESNTSKGVNGKAVYDALILKPDLIEGKNLFNKDTVTAGQMPLNGTPTSASTRSYSDFIPVLPLETYISNYVIYHTAYYDTDKNLITGGTTTINAETSFTTPATASYIIITVYNSYITSQQLEHNSVITDYVYYQQPSILSTQVKKTNAIEFANKDLVDSGTIFNALKSKASLLTGKNLFNKSIVTAGQMPANGIPTAAGTRSYSDYIPIIGGETYISNKQIWQTAYYNSNKELITGGTTEISENTSFTTPVNASYIIITISNTEINYQQLETGNTVTDYENYIFGIDDTKVNKAGIIEENNTGLISGGGIYRALETKAPLLEGKNKLNKNELNSGSMLVDGSVYANDSRSHTDFIKVNTGDEYVSNYIIYYVTYFDSYKNLLTSGLSTVNAGTSFTIPASVDFMRVTVLNTNTDLQQIEVGAVSTKYTEYYNGVSNSYTISDVDISLISDTHVTDTYLGAGSPYPTASKVIEDCISLLKKKPSDFAIHLGDVVDSTTLISQKTEAERLFKRLGLPIYYVLGNHDVELDSQSSINDYYDNISDAYYSNPFSFGAHGTKLGYYHVNVRGVDLIILNQMHDNDATSKYKIDDTQLTWLQTTLNSITGDERRLIICSHISLTPNLDQTDYYRFNETQGNSIRAMIETWQTNNGIVLGCFSGHEHQNTFDEINGINYVCFQALEKAEYTGSISQMAYAHVKWSEDFKRLTIDGRGSQNSYVFDY